MSLTRLNKTIAMPSQSGAAGFAEKLGILRSTSVVLLFLVATVAASSAQTFTSLLSFNNSDGQAPHVTLVQGANGNFYGTTFAGGSHNGGTVFEITPGGTLTTLYNFCSKKSCADGIAPFVGLVLGTNGFLYGITQSGGVYNYGTVFKISSAGKLTTIHSFDNTDGAYPYAALVQATNGNFYGTTDSDGSNNAGTVFEITPAGTSTSLYRFCSQPLCADGLSVEGTLIQDSNGKFYGTTYLGGGPGGGGTVFEITPAGQLTTLHSFDTRNGGLGGFYPSSGVVQASNGNLYGTTVAGGTNCADKNGCGTAFEITTAGDFTSLYSFCPQSRSASSRTWV